MFGLHLVSDGYFAGFRHLSAFNAQADTTLIVYKNMIPFLKVEFSQGLRILVLVEQCVSVESPESSLGCGLEVELLIDFVYEALECLVDIDNYLMRDNSLQYLLTPCSSSLSTKIEMKFSPRASSTSPLNFSTSIDT
jgi:hypothetical protein